MLSPYWTGLFLSTAALLLWSLSPFCFAAMGRRVGPFATNLLRLGLAALLLLGFIGFRQILGYGYPLPSFMSWLWLSGSGIIGLVVGDFFLYRILTTEGPEKTSQIQTLVPAATAVMAWIFLREYLSMPQIIGMALILGGVFLATWDAAQKRDQGPASDESRKGKAELKNPKLLSSLMNGAWAGVWSSLFQGLGTVMARQAFLANPDLDPILATTIRITSGALVLWIFARSKGPVGPLIASCRQPLVIKLLIAGTLIGTLLGMICYISALKYIPAGIVSTITFMNPLLVIPLGAWHYGTRIGASAIVGTSISLLGVILLGFG